jgi:hypothetical protein
MRRLYAALFVLLVIALPPGRVSALDSGRSDVIWLEAEHFANTGGWSNDPQFVDLMGSPYLLATGVGKPVKDAVTKARVAKAGEYRLWVRCKDWYPQYSPGQFQVLVGPSFTVGPLREGESRAAFGKAADDRWRWVDGGTFALEAGEIDVAIHDVTGWFGRCDAVVLARDALFRPADDLAELARQREAFGGIPAEIENKAYDIVVIGGGLAGSAAAVAASRLGRRVALIQDRPVLGGNASVEIGVPPEGDKTNEPLDPRETGIIEEFEPPSGKTGDWSSSIEPVVRQERKVDLYFNTRAIGAAMKDSATIASVDTLDIKSGKRTRFAGRLFIDCTGDAWVGYWAGAQYRRGREARGEFNEGLAPEESDPHTMGNTLYAMNFVTRDDAVEFEAPPWAYQWDSPDDFQDDPVSPIHTDGNRPANFENLKKGPGRAPLRPEAGHREWWVEHGGMSDTIQDSEAIRDELFRINLGLWNYAKNYHPRFKLENRNKELVWLNYVPGKRESRRLVGDYVMTQRDYSEKIVHRDNIAYGGWAIDDHHPWGFFSYGNAYYVAYPTKVSIPYRCLYSQNIANLMMAGRDISVSHVALGGVRVMRTCCLMGQAAGTGAAIALAHDTSPRGVYEQYLDELQDQLLKDGAYLMGRPNRDPHDLARAATVTASSVASELVRLEPANVVNGWNRVVAGAPNSWGPDPSQPLPQWVELGFPAPIEFNTIHVTFQLPSLAARAYRMEARQGDSEWKTILEESDNSARRRVHTVPAVRADRLRLVLEKPGADNASPRVCEIRVYNEP